MRNSYDLLKNMKINVNHSIVYRQTDQFLLALLHIDRCSNLTFNKLKMNKNGKNFRYAEIIWFRHQLFFIKGLE